MKTPICDFVDRYVEKNCIRAHMPGHKGKDNFSLKDITEINFADSLYEPTGIIKESEDNASLLFGSKKTCFSTEGSSQCIKAMLHLAKMHKNVEGRGCVLATRNAHSAFISASILLDFDICWIYSDNASSYLSCDISYESLDAYLCKMENKPFAVYVTSPDYLGNMLDIKSLSVACKKHDVPLLVDNAHGAYLKFTNPSTHPLDLGADLCCDSAHKTLPALTGGAYLHISKNTSNFYSENVKSVMMLYGSTSPSYLTLYSLDKLNGYIDTTDFKQKLNNTIITLDKIKKRLGVSDFYFVGSEKLKLTIDAKKYGYFGKEMYDILFENDIVCEFCDEDFLVLMVSSETTDSELRKIEQALLSIPKKEALPHFDATIRPLERALTTREAIFSKKSRISVDNAKGKIIASLNITCPPAVSLVVCGEIIDENVIKLLKRYGIDEVQVVDDK